jgi:uncharacterized C2H2 Zn-finger protein
MAQKPTYIVIKCRICGKHFYDEDSYWKHHMDSHTQYLPRYIKKEYFIKEDEVSR